MEASWFADEDDAIHGSGAGAGAGAGGAAAAGATGAAAAAAAVPHSPLLWIVDSAQ